MEEALTYLEMNAVKTKQVSGDTKYSFPGTIKIVPFRSQYLAIAVETANWIVLKNTKQLSFFKLLLQHSIAASLSIFEGDFADAREVVTQIEARKLYDGEVQRIDREETLHVYLTTACNLRCPHCYMSAGIRGQNELTTLELSELLFEFSQVGGKKITFSGGEVCLRVDFAELLQSAKQYGFEVSVLTNGTLWSNEMINSLSQYIDRVQVSIDGYDELTNSKVRGHGNFEKSLSAVDGFIRNKVRTEVAMTPLWNESLESEVVNYANFARTLMDKYAGADFEVKFTGEIMDGRDIALSDVQKGRYLHVAEEVFNNCYGNVSDVPFVLSHRKREISNNCRYGQLSVMPNGDTFFCSAVPAQNPFANIRTVPFKEIWEMSQRARSLSEVTNLEPCKGCELMYICGGECRLKNFESFSDGRLEQVGKPVRTCNQQHKDYYYQLMVDTNEKIFQ